MYIIDYNCVVYDSLCSQHWTLRGGGTGHPICIKITQILQLPKNEGSPSALGVHGNQRSVVVAMSFR